MKIIILVGFMLLLLGCSSKTLVNTYESLPDLSKYENQDKKGNKGEMSVSLFSLNNYTDTPRAGMRSANIIEGILLTKGFKVINHFKIDASKLTDVKNISKNDKSMYYLIGGVSEWRYKTGIDGEPAVSIQCSMYETKTDKLVWSATGADSDWGNGSIGTTAQNLLEDMMN